MKIYTKTGDKGETALYGGTRVSKASARVESYGNIDELNSFIGVAKSQIDEAEVLAQLKKIQFNLFTVGSEAATPIDKLFRSIVMASIKSLPQEVSRTARSVLRPPV